MRLQPERLYSRLSSSLGHTSHDMTVLERLFEKHFRAPATRVLPLQGQLGGSGRNIIRLANDQNTAIGILYGVREENVAFVEFSRAFRRERAAGAADLCGGAGPGRVPRRRPRRPDALSVSCRKTARATRLRPRCGGVPQGGDDFAALPSGDARQDRLQAVLSAGELRPPVDCVGPELFQVSLSAAGGSFVQRAGTRG